MGTLYLYRTTAKNLIFNIWFLSTFVVILYMCNFDLRRSCMDLELCYYLRSRGSGLKSLLRTHDVWKQWTWTFVLSLAVDMKLCNSILHGTLGTIVDHVVKCGYMIGGLDIELCSSYKNLLKPDLEFCNFAVRAFRLHIRGWGLRGHRTLYGIAKCAKTWKMTKTGHRTLLL